MLVSEPMMPSSWLKAMGKPGLRMLCFAFLAQSYKFLCGYSTGEAQVSILVAKEGGKRIFPMASRLGSKKLNQWEILPK